jgi:hypothetical protein
MGARFSAPLHTSPGAHLVSYTMGTGSVRWVKRPGRGPAVQLYLYSTYGFSWPSLGRSLCFTFTITLSPETNKEGNFYHKSAKPDRLMITCALSVITACHGCVTLTPCERISNLTKIIYNSCCYKNIYHHKCYCQWCPQNFKTRILILTIWRRNFLLNF